MKLILGFELSSEKVDLNYRKTILSFIKHLLSTRYEDDFNVLFSDPIIKSYTFSVYFPNVKMVDNSIFVKDRQMSVTISGIDNGLIAKIYNASLGMKNKSYPMANNSMLLQKVRLDNSNKQFKEKCLIKFLSPLVVRKRIDNKDTYLTFADNEFNQYINIATNNLFKQLDSNTQSVDISLQPFNARATVVKQDDIMFQANIGTYVLEGDSRVIEILYQTGIGSRRGQGFGMFEIIGG